MMDAPVQNAFCNYLLRSFQSGTVAVG